MIYEVIVTNPSGSELTIPLGPSGLGLNIVDIQGLGPAKTNINLRENAGISGSIFTSARTPSRNIVFTLNFFDFVNNEVVHTIEMARRMTYEYFPIESRIKIDVVTDAGRFWIYGFVESNEPNIFSSNQGCVISVLCPDPYFRDYNEIISDAISQSSQLFTFPFSNATGTTSLIFGEMLFSEQDYPIHYDGTINVGPTIYIHAVGGTVTDPTITFRNEQDSTDVDTLSFAFTSGLPALQNGDYLKIVCEKQNKSVTRFRASDSHYINYIGTVVPGSTWPVLKNGDNLFSYSAADAENIRFEYEYIPKYSGI